MATKKVEEVVKTVGRPKVYSDKVMEHYLRAYAGQKGGLKAAHEDIQKQTGHAKVTLVTVWNLAKKLGISFGKGKPTQKPVAVLPKKRAKKPVEKKEAA